MVKPVVDTFTLIEGNNFADFMDAIMTLLQIFSFWATDGRYVQACSLSLSLAGRCGSKPEDGLPLKMNRLDYCGGQPIVV